MAKKPYVFVTREIPRVGIKLLQKRCNVKVWDRKRKISRDELLKNVRGAAGILSLLTEKIDEEVLKTAGPELKIVANFAVGYDNIDLAACKKHKVWVTNTPGILTEAVAEHTMALLLACARHIVDGDDYVRKGKYKQWEPMIFLGPQIYGKTLGIIGLGRIGAYVAQMAFSGFHVNILYHDVKRNEEFEEMFEARYVSINELLKESDFVTLHVPLLPSTHHLIGKPQFKIMKKNAILINTARGPVVDERALGKALRDGQIGAAGIDVLEFEPDMAPGLEKLPNIVITPHIASATEEARDMMAEMAAKDILLGVFGRVPPNMVE